jgi:aryl-alcohol dehydrogenase-like predicted oxidoreductase
MPLPDHAYQTVAPDLRLCRVLNGLWQVSGAHGQIDPKKAIPAMLEYHDAGLTSWDLADHYGPAEDFIGQFRAALQARDGESTLAASQALTKWVPRPTKMTRAIVQEAVAVSLRRMHVKQLDVLQFHWWDYRIPGYLEALQYLQELTTQGQLRHLALTNFDTQRVQEITEYGIQLLSNQVQFSIIDRRPEVSMIPYCQQAGIYLLPYGVLCGGLLSERYLGQPAPSPSELTTASLRKYYQMIEAWGGWRLFQALLQTLQQIADKHHSSIATVATCYILGKPMVAGVIIGTRLGVREHRAATLNIFDLTLEAEDIEQINSFAQQARDLYRAIGDCGDEYRR